MAEKEMQAHDMVRRRNWSRAVVLYDHILAQLPPHAAAAAVGSNNNSNSNSVLSPASNCSTTSSASSSTIQTSSNSNSSSSSSSASTNSSTSSSSSSSTAVSAASSSTRTPKDRQIACLLGRCECLLELTRYDSCLADARMVLALLSDQSAECLASVSRARRWLVHALCKLKKYTVSLA